MSNEPSRFARAVLSEISKKSHSIIDDHDPASGVWAAETNLQIDPVSLKNLFFTEDWVYIVVDKIALRIASQPLKVFRKQIERGKTLLFSAEDHPTQARFVEPNQFQSFFDWMYNIVVDLAHMGNAIIWDARRANILQPIFAETVSLIFDENTGRLEKYVVVDDTHQQSAGIVGFEFSPETIIHIKRPNPSSFFWGLSPFIPGRKAVLFNRYTSEFLNNFYIKGATPSLKVEIDKDVNEKSALRMLRSFQQAHSGRRNQHAPLLLPKGVSASPISTTLADQQLAEYVNQNRETIMNLLGVPKHELSLQSAGSLGSQETRLLLRNFWMKTLIPLMKIIEGQLNRAFSDELGSDHEIKFDLSDVDELKDDQIKKGELAQLLTNTHTINEIRQKLYDLEPHPTGDVLLSVSRINPQTFIPNETTRPSVPESEFSPEDQKALNARINKLNSYLAMNKTWWGEYRKQFDANSRKSEQELSALVFGAYLRYLGQAVPLVRQSIVEGKQKDEINDKHMLQKKLEQIFDSFQREWQDEHTRVTSNAVDFGYDTTLQVPFNLQDTQAIRAVGERDEKGRRAILSARGIEAFSFIKKNEVERSMAIIEAGLKRNETVDQIAKNLSREYSDSQKVSFRAQRIARTETATAVMLGKRAAMNDASEVVPGLQKVWVNANDVRVRGRFGNGKANHWRLQGETRGINERFSNGLKHPLDASAGRPEEVINCRCDVLLLPPDQALAGVGSGITGG